MPAEPQSFLTSATPPSARASGFGDPTVESAPGAGEAILGNREEAAWIVDREGNLFLPADQARLRPSPSPATPGVD